MIQLKFEEIRQNTLYVEENHRFFQNLHSQNERTFKSPNLQHPRAKQNKAQVPKKLSYLLQSLLS